MDNTDKKRTAGIIVAASHKGKLRPLLQMGSISVIKRIVLTYQHAGVSPIVVITGHQAGDIEHELADYNIIFLHNPDYEETDMFSSAKIGLEFLQDKCEQIIFTPVHIPMFSPDTIRRLMASGEALISPSYRKKAGHPLLLSADFIPQILEYQGNQGLRGAIDTLGIKRKYMEVEDACVLHNMDELEQMDELIKQHNEYILHPFLKISIEKEKLFFNSRTKFLLILIQETGSVKSACKHMALSYSNAWNMLNELEKELGYAVIKRRRGGKYGGKTDLTAEGIDFLEKYQEFEVGVRQYAREAFARIFQRK